LRGILFRRYFDNLLFTSSKHCTPKARDRTDIRQNVQLIHRGTSFMNKSIAFMIGSVFALSVLFVIPSVHAATTTKSTHSKVSQTHNKIRIALSQPNTRAKITTEEADNIKVYKMCNQAVVNITTGAAPLQNNLFNVVPQGTGSGSIVSAEGYILTNF